MNSQEVNQKTMHMVIAARTAVQRWKSNPNLPGEACFALFSDRPELEAAPFRFRLVGTTPDGYIFAIHAQDILDLLEDPETDRPDRGGVK